MSARARRRKVVVVATEPVTKAATAALTAALLDDEVIVIAPVLLSRLQYWTSDDSRARAEAEARLAGWLRALQHDGVENSGYVTDADPIQLIEDARAVLLAETVVVVTTDSDQWQVRNLPQRARARFGTSITAFTANGERYGVAIRARTA